MLLVKVADLKVHSVAAETETTEAAAKDVTITAVARIVAAAAAAEALVKVLLEQEEITEAEILLTEVLVNN
jgi:hypothetical protein